MVKMAIGLFEMNKKRVVEEGEEAVDQAEIQEYVAPRVKEIDSNKREEAEVLLEIN